MDGVNTTKKCYRVIWCFRSITWQKYMYWRKKGKKDLVTRYKYSCTIKEKMVSSFFHFKSAIVYSICWGMKYTFPVLKILRFLQLKMQYTLVYISSESDHIIALKLLLSWYDCYGVNNLFRILCLKGLGNDSSLYLSFIISVPLSLRVREEAEVIPMTHETVVMSLSKTNCLDSSVEWAIWMKQSDSNRTCHLLQF